MLNLIVFMMGVLEGIFLQNGVSPAIGWFVAGSNFTALYYRIIEQYKEQKSEETE